MIKKSFLLLLLISSSIVLPVKSDFGDAKNIKFCSLPKGWNGGWHNSPVKQFVVGVSGTIQITCSDNSQVTVSKGNVVLLEDLTGKGHHTEVTSNESWNGVLVEI